MSNNPYSLITISSLIILSYIISYLLSKSGVYQKKNHRQIWNVLLLFTFFTTALIGLLLVIKINYKLQLPFYNSLMKYHVEFGIAMSILAVIHFSWHIKYYLNMLKPADKSSINVSAASEPKLADIHIPSLKLIVFLVGFTSIIAQIILLREFISVFNGNELVIGVILTNWMILTAIGAYLGQFMKKMKNNIAFLCLLLLFLALFAFASASLISYLKNIVFPLGIMISIYQVFYSSFIILLPVCLLTGICFTVTSKIYSMSKNENRVSMVYGLESAGSITGGLLFSLLLIFILSQYHSLLLLILINSIGVIYISRCNSSKKLYIIASLLAAISIVGMFINLEKPLRKNLFPNQEIIISKNSPYGNTVITRQFDEYNVYHNNVLLFNTESIIENEEAVHYAMCQHQAPGKVLLLTGGLSDRINEILKYNIEHIDYIEFDKNIVHLLKDSVDALKHSAVELHITDPRRYLQKCKTLYDIILINLPEPSTIHHNRFYTLEFFTLLKKNLNKDGIISFPLLSSANYLNDEAIQLLSGIYFTLNKVFKNVIIIPGEKNYFIASDSIIDYHIVPKITGTGIDNVYVNEYYIQDELLEMRSNLIRKSLIAPKQLNKDLKPLAYHQQVNYWLKYFTGKFWIPAICIVILILLIFIKLNIFSRAMFIAGFSASGLEILIMFSLQVFFGNIYYLTGIVFAFFMLGLVAGAIYSDKIIRTITIKTLSVNHFILLIYAVFLILMLWLFNRYFTGNAMVYCSFAVFTIMLGIITGAEFSFASKLLKGNYGFISGTTYSADLIGSAAGAFVITIYVIPWLGLILSGIFIGIINLFIALYLILLSKRKG